MVQLAAMFSSLTGRFLLLPPRHLRLLVACGATAGITSAYNAPIAGALGVIGGGQHRHAPDPALRRGVPYAALRIRVQLGSRELPGAGRGRRPGRAAIPAFPGCVARRLFPAALPPLDPHGAGGIGRRCVVGAEP
ncbi:hypothetical protein G6F65_020463 [Rhizopus arrhizus]|nr:hypothetical protein G6F65_020463 [Rhizopus arrhizus]